MASPVLQFKRGLLANLPGLQAGEPAFTTDSFDLFVGLTSETNTNKFFGSHRYWTKETTSTGSGVNLVEGTSNGSEYITLKSPDSLAGIVTYILPGTQGSSSSVLTNDGSGNLTWASGSANPVFTGIATFSDTTDNTLGDADTGAVQIDGGVGIAKNVTVGAGLSVAEIGTFSTGAVIDTVQIGISGASEIDTSTGDLVLDSATGQTTIDDNLSVQGDTNITGIATIANLDVQTDFDIYAPTATFHDNVIIEGNLTVNGTETIINTITLTVQDKEIILGVGTNGSPSDASATGGGISIASTEGNPLVDFFIAGIHTHPNTYKDIVWIRADDLGVGTTDAWHFNYAVGIGSTQVADGVRLAVTNTQITDDTLSTPQVNVSGASTVGGLLDANGGADITGQVTLNNDLSVTGVSTFTGLIDANGGLDVLGHSELDNVNVSGIITAASVVFGSGTAITSVDTDLSTVSASDDTLASAKAIKAYVDSQVTAQDLDFAGDSGTGAVDLDSQTFTIAGTTNEIVTSGAGTTITIGLPDNVTVTGEFTVGTGVGITQFSSDVGSGTSTSSVPTSSAVIEYIRNSDFGLVGDSGSGNVNMDHNLSILGTANEIETSVSSQTVTVGLPDAVVVGTSLSAPTIRTNIIQSQNTGATVLTLTADDAQVAGDLTVGGNLYVNGSTTQVNTSSLTVEDRTIELGIVDGSAPSSTTTWDLGVLFNYFQTSAKKSAVVWEQADARFKFGSEISDGGGTDNDSPQITFTAFAPIEIGALWVNDCAGQSQVISCTGSTRYLENITIDAGTF